MHRKGMNRESWLNTVSLQLCVVMYQMVSAVDHLHRNQVAHCDIKLDNFLCMDKFDVATPRVWRALCMVLLAIRV